MLLPRIIPVLLIKDKGLVKTLRFQSPKYVGDPINAVRIFNEKEVDELTILDIDASVTHKEPDYKVIENLASECRMPLCYGGGIQSVEQAKRILSLGVEKIAMSTAAIQDPEIVAAISAQVGSQSVVVIIDAKKRLLGQKYESYIHNGNKNMKICPFEFAKKAELLGAGEIVINSIDNDGLMKGYDLELIRQLKSQVSVPCTALGGAGSIDHFKSLIMQEGIVGVAAGSQFVFKGKYRAVLINYPSKAEKEQIFSSLS